MPRLAGVGSRCHNNSNTLRQQQQQLADVLVQVPPNNYVPCCRAGGSRRRGGWWLCRLYAFWCSIFSPAQLLSLCCDMCLLLRGCPAVLEIELSVNARYQKTRVLLRARRLLLLLGSAASGGVRHKLQIPTYM